MLLTSNISAQFFKIASLLPQAHSFQSIEPEKITNNCTAQYTVSTQTPAVNKVTKLIRKNLQELTHYNQPRNAGVSQQDMIRHDSV